MGKGKNKLLKGLLVLGMGYVVYRMVQVIVDKFDKEEEESKNVEEKSNKGSTTKKRK